MPARMVAQVGPRPGRDTRSLRLVRRGFLSRVRHRRRRPRLGTVKRRRVSACELGGRSFRARPRRPTHVPCPASAVARQAAQRRHTEPPRASPVVCVTGAWPSSRELDRHRRSWSGRPSAWWIENRPLPRNLYLHWPLSLLLAFFTVRPAQLRDLALLLRGSRGRRRWRRQRAATAAATRRRGREPADGVSVFSVNHSAPSGPEVIPPGSEAGDEVTNSFVSTPVVVIRPIRPAPVSVNQSAWSTTRRDGKGPAPTGVGGPMSPMGLMRRT